MQFGLLSGTKPELKWLDDPRMVREHQLEKLSRWVATAPEMVLDYEADGLHPYRGAKPFSVQFFAPGNGAKYVDFRLLGANGEAAVRDGLNKRTGITIVHNGTMEVGMSSRCLGVNSLGKLWDNQAASYAVREKRPDTKMGGGHRQKSLVITECGREPTYAIVLDSWLTANIGTTDTGYDMVPMDLIVPYGCEDVTDAWGIYQKLRAQCEREGLMDLVYTDSEMCWAIEDMKHNGLRLNADKADRLAKRLNGEMKELYRTIVENCGRHLDISGHGPVFGLLYGDFGLPLHKDIEKSGKLDKGVLAWMLSLDVVKSDPKKTAVIKAILEWRERDKIVNTYLLPWVVEHQYKGRIHADLNTTSTGTRRFSSSNPNLQNVPVRTELGQELREVIESDPDEVDYSADYSQVEYRLFTHNAGEPALIQGYQSNRDFDIHALVAEMLGLPRKKGKNINFGMLYGMGLEKLVRELMVELLTGKQILKDYHAKIPATRKLKDRLEAQIRKTGTVTDIFGGRRHLTPDEAYKSLNTACQMEAADLLRAAIVKVFPVVKRHGGKMKLQIHDELMFSFPGNEPEEHREALEEVRVAMEDFPQFKVPIYTDQEWFNTNWRAQAALPWNKKAA